MFRIKLQLILLGSFLTLNLSTQSQETSITERQFSEIRQEIERNPKRSISMIRKFHYRVNLKSNDRDKGLAAMLFGQYYLFTNSIIKADSCFTNAYLKFEGIKDQKQMAKAKVASANVLYIKGEYKKSISVFLNSIELFRKEHDTLNMANLYNNVGAVFLQLQEYDKSKVYYEKALFMYKHTSDLNGQSLVLRKLGTIYFNDDEYERAKKYNLEAKSICIKNNDSLGIGNCHVNLGNIDYEWKKDYPGALKNYILAEQIFYKIGATCEAVFATSAIGQTYYEMKDYRLAKKTLIQSLNQVKECEYSYKLPDIYKTLAYTEKQVGNYQQAFEYLELNKQLSDSIFKNDNAVIQELETKYRTAEKDNLLLQGKVNLAIKTAKITKQYNMIWLMILVGILLIIILGGLFYFNRRQRKINVELANVNQFKDQLFTVIGHDLRSPIAGIHISTNDEGIKQKATHALAIMDELLVWGKSNQFQATKNSETISVGMSLDEMTDEFQGIITEKGLLLELSVDAGFKITLDKNEWMIVLRNLFANAVKFATEGSTVSIYAKDKKLEIINAIDHGIISGSATGLMIVQSICDQNQMTFDFIKNNDSATATIHFNK